VTGDWLTLAMDRMQAAQREVRLTLPPGQHCVFWNTLLERARLIPDRLSFHVLLPATVEADEDLSTALNALIELESTRHVVSVSVGRVFPFFLLVTDRDGVMTTVGDAFNGDDATIVQTTDDSQYVAELVDSFDRRFADGINEPDLFALVEWLKSFPHKKDARSALSMMHRGQAKLDRSIQRSLKNLPRRQFWLIKPSPGAWGMEDDDGLSFDFWLKFASMHLGWPALASTFKKRGTVKLEEVKSALQKAYSEVHDAERVRATAQSFLHSMRERDRIIAMDGWTSKQDSVVNVFAWGKIAGAADKTKAAWPIARPVQWRELNLKIPVRIVRDCTGLQSATHPIHRLPADAFRSLVEATEARASKVSAPQLSLTLDLFANLEDQQRLL
jgi:hypothetical protein